MFNPKAFGLSLVAGLLFAIGFNCAVLGQQNNPGGSVVGARTVLTGPITMYRRLLGNDTFCTGLVDANYVSGVFPQPCAKQGWNVLYATAANTLDKAGFDVTLKSGTQDTVTGANVGLFISVPCFGGGKWIIDLAGSNIAETGTKGFINDVVQSCQITLQNTAPGALGTGGNISSTGFACIQNDQPSSLNIGIGISTGPCFDAHYEAIQTGDIYFTNPVNWGCNGAASCAGNELFLVGSGSTIGLNGQTFNQQANVTWTVTTGATAVVSSSGYLQANSAVFNAGGKTTTGQKYLVTLNGSIYTANSGENFLPGSLPGNVDSGGCYDSRCIPTWLNYTPTVTSGGVLGSFTINSALFTSISKTVTVTVTVTTTAGTGTGALVIGLPAAFPSTAAQYNGTAFNVSTAKSGGAIINGQFADTTHMSLTDSTGATMIAAGAIITGQITYQTP